MERLTETCWRNLDPWECCGQDYYCQRGCHDKGGCTNGCIVPKLYARLATYEDTGLAPEEIIEVQDAMASIPFGRFHDIMEAERAGRLALPSEPNDPLTMEELLKMDGEPVFLKHDSSWAIVCIEEGNAFLQNIYGEKCLAEYWIRIFGNIYRRKPEEGANQ